MCATEKQFFRILLEETDRKSLAVVYFFSRKKIYENSE